MSRWNPDSRRAYVPHPRQVAPDRERSGGAIWSLLLLVGLIVAGVFAFRNAEGPPAADLNDQLNQINQKATQGKKNLENAQSEEIDKLINKGAENQRKARELEAAMEKRREGKAPLSESEQIEREESSFLRKHGRLLIRIAILAAIGAVLLYRATRG